ncbi:hypothetical protein AB0E08_35385 [Streptomyces sp. NPDC048281]|uniref:hypothetical protein n=1 Tax=Streptomyces sp. NPDC048281 TaxID=3154715 RepID=UPI00343983DB
MDAPGGLEKPGNTVLLRLRPELDVGVSDVVAPPFPVPLGHQPVVDRLPPFASDVIADVVAEQVVRQKNASRGDGGLHRSTQLDGRVWTGRYLLKAQRGGSAFGQERYERQFGPPAKAAAASRGIPGGGGDRDAGVSPGSPKAVGQRP